MSFCGFQSLFIAFFDLLRSFSVSTDCFNVFVCRFNGPVRVFRRGFQLPVDGKVWPKTGKTRSCGFLATLIDLHLQEPVSNSLYNGFPTVTGIPSLC